MNVPTPTPPALARRRARRLRLIGSLVLLLGLGGAGAVYWLGTRGPELSDDPAMLGYHRAADRQMAILYGKQGRLIEDFSDALKQPGTQAGLIGIVTVVIGAGCFYFARLLDYDAGQ